LIVNTLRERHFESAQPDGSEAPIPTIVPVNLRNENGKFISKGELRCGMQMNQIPTTNTLYLCSAASSPSNLILNLIPIE
jgi:hypothetical protein